MMKLSNPSKSGFTLFEVVMAMGIVTLAFTSVAGIQLRTMHRTHKDSFLFGKTLLLKSKLYDFLLEQGQAKKTLTKKIDADGGQIKLATREIAKKSSLSSLSEKILVLAASTEWKVDDAQEQAQLVTFLYKPRERKEK